jgi:hypothetical protein
LRRSFFRAQLVDGLLNALVDGDFAVGHGGTKLQHTRQRFSDPIRLVRIGEADGELATGREQSKKGPIQLAWMVNKLPAATMSP